MSDLSSGQTSHPRDVGAGRGACPAVSMSTPSRPTSSHASRLSGLDGLRGLAALAVVVLHVWMYTDANRRDHSVLVDAVIGELRVAVVAFFVLSGFLLARPWVQAARGERPAPRLGTFAMRRLARVVPAYWVAVAGSFLLLNGTGHGRATAPETLPLFVLFLHNLFPETRGKLDPPMWSLCVEVTFYAVLPLIGWLIVRAARRRARTAAVRGPLLVCALLAAIGLAWTAAGEARGWPPEVMWALPTYLAQFACGIAAAVLAHGRRPGRGVALGLLAAGTFAVVANGVWHSDGTGFTGHVIGDLPAAAGFAAIVAVVALRPAGLLSIAPMRWLGAISYGVYLWHMPVLYGLQVHDAFPERAVPALAAVIAPTFALAAASWLLVERPILRRTQGRGPGAPRPAPGDRTRPLAWQARA
jgi:peptidoglycan/LPS O-acetylase OafA/YrhL